MEDVISFVDLDGKIWEDPKISSHVGLIDTKIFVERPELKEQFEASGYEQKDSFFREELGWAQVSATLGERFMIVNRDKSTKVQKTVLWENYGQYGYKVHYSQEESLEKRGYKL